MADSGQQMEVVNITKIRDGFFIGDGATASNLEVILTFKITHIINTSPTQVMNTYENIGVKYLSINWSENNNQNLFDVKDEIANKIVNFIDESQKVGEGLLINSLKAQNRCCVCVLIYFIKKYNWTVSKSLEFLTSKKQDVDITKPFLTQLHNFESRILRASNVRNSEWAGEGQLDLDPEETLMKNTYLNGLGNKGLDTNFTGKSKEFNFTSKKIKWVDNLSNKKEVLCFTNYSKDLVFIKDVKPITIHKKLKPHKSSFKNPSHSYENNSKNISKQPKNEGRIDEIIDPSIVSNNSRPRSYSQNQKSLNNLNSDLDSKKSTNIQIITPVVSKVVNNNYNNYYITPSSPNVFPQYYGSNNAIGNIDQYISGNIKPVVNMNYEQGQNVVKNDRPNSVKVKENNNNSTTTTYKTSNISSIKNDKFKSNYVTDSKGVGVIDYSNGNNFMRSANINTTNYTNKPLIPTQSKHGQNLFQNEIKKSPSTPLINQGNTSTNLLSKSTNVKPGPVKIQDEKNELYNNIPTVKKNAVQQIYNPKMYSSNQSSSQININQKGKENIYERPSTAPSKNDIKPVPGTMSSIPISNSTVLKRLPSPNVKSSNLMSDNNKNPLYSSVKYRSPSPANLLTNNKGNFGMSSFKGIPSKKLK